MNNDMNIFKAQVQCPNCNTKSIFTAKQLINATTNPHALEQVLDASWFRHTCPVCGEQQIVLFTCLYYDQANRLLYGYADSEEDKKKLSSYFTQDEDNKEELASALSGWIDTCKCRLTDDFSSFQEKLLLSYLNLDDRAIEICKYMTEIIVTTQKLVPSVSNMYFNTDGDQWIFVIADGNGEMTTTALPKEMYEEVKENLTKNTELDDSAYVIDRTWAINYFNNYMQ